MFSLARLTACATMFGCLLLLGCGAAGNDKGTIKGKVSYKGKDLTTGTISFHDESEKLVGSSGIANGMYIMEKVPTGPVKVTVQVIASTGPEPKESKDPTIIMPTRAVPIPDKYKSPKTSGLAYTVSSGEQTKDFPLD